MPKGRVTKIPMSLQQIVVGEFSNGQSASDLARSHELSRATVYGILRRNGLRPMDNYAVSRKLKGDVEAIVGAYQSGASLPQIAKQHGLSYGAARNAVIRSGLKPRGPSLRVSESLDSIVSAYQSGESQVSIAKRLGVSEAWVGIKLKQAGVPLDHRRSGSNHGSWKGGRQRHGGYIGLLMANDDPFFCMANASGYVLEHRLVIARSLGRVSVAGTVAH